MDESMAQYQQIVLWHDDGPPTLGHAGPAATPAASASPGESAQPCLSDYDRIVVFFSGGKDSVACVLHLLDAGVPPDRIELHHHLVDGREGSALMDWPVTESYCQAFAKALGLTIYMSWKMGGFEGEMTRRDARTAPIAFESETGQVVQTGGTLGDPSTRMMFPQVTADLRMRWCSAYLKIDVGARLLNNEPRFQSGKTLVVTGERAAESAARSKYRTFEAHRCDNRDGQRNKRWIDHWRPVHRFDDHAVWALIERHRINPHPAYHLGWGRTSCLSCIFGSANQWATIRRHMPEKFSAIRQYEHDFGKTIHRTLSVDQLADRGVPYDCDPVWLSLAMSDCFDAPVVIDPWCLPKGAFGESHGPL